MTCAKILVWVFFSIAVSACSWAAQDQPTPTAKYSSYDAVLRWLHQQEALRECNSEFTKFMLLDYGENREMVLWAWVDYRVYLNIKIPKKEPRSDIKLDCSQLKVPQKRHAGLKSYTMAVFMDNMVHHWDETQCKNFILDYFVEMDNPLRKRGIALSIVGLVDANVIRFEIAIYHTRHTGVNCW